MPGLKRFTRKVIQRLGYDLHRYQPPAFEPERYGKPIPARGHIEVNAFRWGSANELFDFVSRDVYNRWDLDAQNYDVSPSVMEKHRWGLKGYGYAFVTETIQKLHATESRRLKILDIGGGGSGLARFIAERFGDEAWVVDDFGVESEDGATQGWYATGLREQLAQQNPGVKYVFGRLGNGSHPELKPGYFDLIFSVSTLEHIPPEAWLGVFDHILELLDPNTGRTCHTIDSSNGQFRAWQKFFAEYFRDWGVAPSTFDIAPFTGYKDDDAPLTESPEIIYNFWGKPPRFWRVGALALDITRTDSAQAAINTA